MDDQGQSYSSRSESEDQNEEENALQEDSDDDVNENRNHKVETKDDDDDDDGNEVIKRKPSKITLEDQVFDIAFHPVKNVISIGEITGNINVFSYSNDYNKKLLDLKHHKKACRCVSFSLDGQRLYSASKDKSICCVDMNTGAIIHHIAKAHKSPVSVMKVISEDYLASGCDNGVIKVWDTRTFSCIMKFDNANDYISDMACNKDKKYLLCTSGDGVLSVYNLRKKKLEIASDQLDDELLCLAVIKNEQKVVCGSSNGVINIFSWGEWGDISDRLPTEHDSIDSICVVTEDIICTGGDDGTINAMFIHPHQNIRKIGKHGTFGIEHLEISSDKNLLASCNSENTVRFWDINDLQNEDLEPNAKAGVKRKWKQMSASKDDFFSEL